MVGSPYIGMPAVNTSVRPRHVGPIVHPVGVLWPGVCLKESVSCGSGTGARGGPLMTLISVSEGPIVTCDG